MKKLLASTILVTGFIIAAGAANSANAAEDCGSITIAEMNWASAGVAAYVDKFIMENAMTARSTSSAAIPCRRLLP